MNEPIEIPLDEEWPSDDDADVCERVLSAPDAALRELLRAPVHPAELDIPSSLVIDILLRMMFSEGEVSLRHFGEVTCLELTLLDHILIAARGAYREVVSGGGGARYAYACPTLAPRQGCPDRPVHRPCRCPSRSTRR